jgi:hypothetical protein
MSPINVISGRTPGRRSSASIRVDIAELACKYVASHVARKYAALVLRTRDKTSKTQTKGASLGNSPLDRSKTIVRG